MATVPPPARVLCHSSASQQCPKPGGGSVCKASPRTEGQWDEAGAAGLGLQGAWHIAAE